MSIPFIKMQALGNDFIVIDQRTAMANISLEQIKLMSDRRLGIGCDQFIIVKPHSQYDCAIEIFNSDGSSAEACGNATRCIATLLPKEHSIISVGLRVLETEHNEHGMVAVNMGLPEVYLNDSLLRFGFKQVMIVDIGNPHLVFFIDDLEKIDVASLGPKFENDPIFPNKTNVSFARIISRNEIELKVWERGAGETLACGTAACAVFAGARKLNMVGGEATLNLPGGSLICIENSDNSITLRGVANKVFEGVWPL